MNRIKIILATAAAAGLLNGCIIVVGDKDNGEFEVDAGWAGTYEDEMAAKRENNAVLADRVSQQLATVESLAAEDITVSVSGEVVTLHGRLRDFDRLQQAVDTAGEVQGVARVVSRITLDIRS